MSRSVGAVEAVQAIVPEEAALLLGLLTQLGDVWFLLTVVVLAYWLRPGDRERTAVVLAIALGTIALVQGAKGLFGLPRPAAPLADPDAFPAVLQGVVEATATAGGHGFPSGHATLSTAVLLGLAGAVRIGEPRRRALIATALLVTISLSRIALGVHFLVDVLAGILFGLAVLAGTALALRSSPFSSQSAAFGIALGLGAAAVAATAPSPDVAGLLAEPARDAVLSLGSAAGALAGWLGSRARSDGGIATAGALLTVLALVAAGIAGVATGEVTAAATGAAGVLFAAIVALPALVPGFDDAVVGRAPRWLRGDEGSAGE